MGNIGNIKNIIAAIDYIESHRDKFVMFKVENNFKPPFYKKA